MRVLSVFILLLVIGGSAVLAQEISSTEDQIAMAVLAAPEDQREAATVMGYNEAGELTLLREGSNKLICISDDPNKDGFQSVCYHSDLEPFMIRGRELRAEGKKPQEIFDIREEEAKAGTLEMPDQPATLHILSGKEGKFDPETGTASGVSYRYVVYIAWATAESSGLPTKPMLPGGPWIMNPGTHRAHIMVTPPRTDK